jgi:hypothetical protein
MTSGIIWKVDSGPYGITDLLPQSVNGGQSLTGSSLPLLLGCERKLERR